MTPLTKSSTPESYKSIIRNKQKKQSRTKRKVEYKKAVIRFEWITAKRMSLILYEHFRESQRISTSVPKIKNTNCVAINTINQST